ncbi:hypothetical protein QYF61_015746 [Mycteria americana]|uniref:Uncharacterized protein n=1 Tax=Mycteria americana TaxID=33587 RepID=A0AAN7N9C4_MYCAM|nr:hypothetical protein QYF61_015746 [Mycteria americana]
MDTIAQVIHECETCAAIKQAKRLKPLWQKSNGEWRLTVDYRGLNEVTPPLSAAVPDVLDFQYEVSLPSYREGGG